ncbi:MAG TPA: AAC(3) family N-acetyltransferase [Pseudomonadales bacterium]|nr:AAC(3) family N-acetyltransferase [Pseudomonadales bacterium]
MSTDSEAVPEDLRGTGEDAPPASVRLSDEMVVDGPFTHATLLADLRALGVRPGMTLLVHTSLSRIGTVLGGGTQAVIQALLDALGPTGTLMMPTHSADLTEPARWRHPPIPAEWLEQVRAEMLPFDPARTPTRAMGVVAEAFRSWPGVLRSGHPHTSFAALGPAARALTGTHRLGSGLGEDSPLGALYRLDGQVLLLGVGHGNNTSLHLAETRARWPSKASHEEGAPMRVDGEARWVTFRELRHEDEDFPRIGAAWETAGGAVALGRVGLAEARLFPQRPLVDFATHWMTEHRR